MDKWTYENGGRQRQIDFLCINQFASGRVREAKATREIGVENDHQGVKMSLLKFLQVFGQEHIESLETVGAPRMIKHTRGQSTAKWRC